jgi:hypothetical protein
MKKPLTDIVEIEIPFLLILVVLVDEVYFVIMFDQIREWFFL